MPDQPPRRRRLVTLVVVGLVVLAAVLLGPSFFRPGASDARPTVTWDESEGHPGCVYDEEGRTVFATIRVDGDASGVDEVTVTVTAYADENTSRPVGSASRTTSLDGTVALSLVMTIPVERPPHVGEDDVAACRLAVEY